MQYKYPGCLFFWSRHSRNIPRLLNYKIDLLSQNPQKKCETKQGRPGVSGYCCAAMLKRKYIFQHSMLMDVHPIHPHLHGVDKIVGMLGWRITRG